MNCCKSKISFVLLFVLSLTGCGGGAHGNELKIKGSDTVLPIAQTLAEDYAKLEPLADISITGGGSGVGIASLLDNTTDIAMSSREMKLSEKLRLEDKKLDFSKVIVAYDALAICVHPSNTVKQLTREQLEQVFTGQITNWKDLGGADQQIVCYSRESSSGTHEFFKEAVLTGHEFAPEVLMKPATSAIVQSVGQTPGAIGYVGLAYLNDEVSALSVSYDGGKTYVKPSIESAQAKTYPIVRPLYFIYLAKKQPRLAGLMKYVLSDEGQAAVLKLGFVPLNDMKAALPKTPAIKKPHA